MTKENVSIKFLIRLLGERPALWDKTIDEYKDRALKANAWREICTHINENYNSLAPKAKEEFTRIIIKKWTHIRDSWVKSMKYGYDEVTKKPPKPYVYHNELKFLQKILKCKPTRSNFNITRANHIPLDEFLGEKNGTQNSNAAATSDEDNTEEQFEIAVHKIEPNDNSQDEVTVVTKAENDDGEGDDDDMLDMSQWNFEDTTLPATASEEQNQHQKMPFIKKRQSIFVNKREESYDRSKINAALVRLVPPTESFRMKPQSHRQHNNLAENRHWNFFKGILPSVTDFDEDHVLNMQSNIIALIQKLRESQKQIQRQREREKTKKSNGISSHSLFKGRGRKRKASLDDMDNDWATHNLSFEKESTRQISDPIAMENENLDSEYSSDN